MLRKLIHFHEGGGGPTVKIILSPCLRGSTLKVDPFLEEPFCARKHTGSHNVPCISRPLEELWCFRVTSREYFSVGLDKSG